MVLTRRDLLGTLLLAGAVGAVPCLRRAGRGPRRRVLRAGAPSRYPGPLRPLRNIGRPGIWRG